MRFVGIDPASKTGFVALDQSGQALKAKEITGVGGEDPKRMVTLIKDIGVHVLPEDVVVIEGFPFNTQRAMFAGGLHHGIRNQLWVRGIPFYEVAPNAVKKFVDVTGWIGEPGSKQRLKGSQKKIAVMDAVKEHFGFEHVSDNVVDAYVMAQIAKSIGTLKVATQYQKEVVESVLYPTASKKPKKKKVKS
ncbi:holliday junction resolvase [Virgibacillus phage Mimir87]|nr:holliday junction resolvase [Virgibacillus phage Mimir87]